jgi:hypothetical protein
VWENTMMSVVDTVASYFTKVWMLEGIKIKADYSTVSALNENELEREDLITKKIDNLQKVINMKPDFDINSEIEKIYGKIKTKN